MEQTFKGKKVLVTAGSEGIGKAIAKTFYQAGASVHICSRTREKLEKCAAEMPGVSFTAADVSVYADDQRTDENNVDVYIAAPFTLAGREQEIVIGGAWNKSELKKNNFGGSYYTGGMY